MQPSQPIWKRSEKKICNDSIAFNCHFKSIVQKTICWQKNEHFCLKNSFGSLNGRRIIAEISKVYAISYDSFTAELSKFIEKKELMNETCICSIFMPFLCRSRFFFDPANLTIVMHSESERVSGSDGNIDEWQINDEEKCTFLAAASFYIYFVKMTQCMKDIHPQSLVIVWRTSRHNTSEWNSEMCRLLLIANTKLK